MSDHTTYTLTCGAGVYTQTGVTLWVMGPAVAMRLPLPPIYVRLSPLRGFPMLFVVIFPTEFALFEQRLPCRAEHHGRYLSSWAKTWVVGASEAPGLLAGGGIGGAQCMLSVCPFTTEST